MRLLDSVSRNTIAQQWDKSVEDRSRVLIERRDRSYFDVLVPANEDHIVRIQPKSVLDVGCGLGFLTNIASKYSEIAVGVDISQRSIEFAEKNFFSKNCRFVCSPVEELPVDRSYDLLIGNMVLMDAVGLEKFVECCGKHLSTNGKAIFTITNPYFWPRYWKYEMKEWFEYGSELVISDNFKTSSTGISGFETVHIHRPVAMYLSAFVSSNFKISGIRELRNPVGHRKIDRKYPRYLQFELVKSC